MKNIVPGIPLLLVLGFLALPAIAAADDPQAAPALSAADRAFLATLAAPAATAPQPARRAAKRPSGMEKALCSAEANCGNGTTVRCEGNNSVTSCSAWDYNCPENGHVTCDGVTTWCPKICPGCGPDFCTWEDHDNCAWSCYPCTYTLNCNTTYCTEFCRCNFRTCPV